MKEIILILLFFNANNSFAQKEVMTTKGYLSFEASVPLFEEVKATNKKVTCAINIKTGAINTAVIMKEFHFKLSLMEEHFNKKYLETENYPKATFKGKIQGFNLNIIGTFPLGFTMKGKLELHGKSKDLSTIVFLKKTKNGLEIISDFNINISDFNIEIPEILSSRVAETVNVKSNFLLK